MSSREIECAKLENVFRKKTITFLDNLTAELLC